MIHSRPTSAYQFHSASRSSIVWNPRPTTALVAIPENKPANLSIDLSTDNEHASLPKETLGSRLSFKMPRPLSAFQNPSPAFKINTQVLSKACKPETTPNNIQPKNSFSHISLAKKLRGLCNTRSFKLLEDCIKEKEIKKPESIANEIKEIWERPHNVPKEKKMRPQSAAFKVTKTNHVYLPGFEKNKLPVIPENKKMELDKLGIAEEDMKYLKKTCEIKVVGKDTGLNIPIFPVFPGKVVKKHGKQQKKLQRSQTEIQFLAS